MSITNGGLLEALSQFGAELPELTKQASIGDGTPDGTVATPHGSRGSENSSDVKSAVPNNVETTSEGSGGVGGQNTATNSIGTNKTPTGEGVPSTKSKKDDPGTSHPAKAGPNGNGSGSEKAAEWEFDGDIIGLGNDILAGIAVASDIAEKQAAAQAEAKTTEPAKTPTEPAVTPVAQTKEAAATDEEKEMTSEEIGYLAGKFAIEQLGLNKQAEAVKTEQEAKVQAEEAAYIEAQCDGLVKQAERHADYLAQYLAGWSKQAMGGLGGEVTDPAALMAGGETPGGGLGDPAAAGAVDAGAPAAGGDEAEAMQLLAALQAAGINPEELIQALAAQGGGGAGAAPAAAVDPSAGAAMAEESSTPDSTTGGTGTATKGAEKEASAVLSKLSPAAKEAVDALVKIAKASRK